MHLLPTNVKEPVLERRMWNIEQQRPLISSRVLNSDQSTIIYLNTSHSRTERFLLYTCWFIHLFPFTDSCVQGLVSAFTGR